jgi:formamidopyrimidine-DNA glycosylase
VPELPEVETTRRGLAPHLVGQTVADVTIRHPQLRWPIPADLPARLTGQIIRQLDRRAKYLLMSFDHGTLILHLGMSGHLRILPAATPAEKHDHFDLRLANNQLMRLHDPRRFGAVLWHEGDVNLYPLLAPLGPEPLQDGFDGGTLYRATRTRRSAIKQVIMDNHVVVGIGNIYANEALFRAGIRPTLPTLRLTRARCASPIQQIRQGQRSSFYCPTCQPS